MDEVDNFTYLSCIISKDGGRSEDAKSRIAKAQGIFSQLGKVWKNTKMSLRINIRTLEAAVMTVIKYSRETWVLRKTQEGLLNVFQTNCLFIPLGSRLIDLTSNSKLNEKCSYASFFRSLMRERLTSPGEKLPKIVVFGQRFRAK